MYFWLLAVMRPRNGNRNRHFYLLFAVHSALSHMMNDHYDRPAVPCHDLCWSADLRSLHLHLLLILSCKRLNLASAVSFSNLYLCTTNKLTIDNCDFSELPSVRSTDLCEDRRYELQVLSPYASLLFGTTTRRKFQKADIVTPWIDHIVLWRRRRLWKNGTQEIIKTSRDIVSELTMAQPSVARTLN